MLKIQKHGKAIVADRRCEIQSSMDRVGPIWECKIWVQTPSGRLWSDIIWGKSQRPLIQRRDRLVKQLRDDHE